MFFFIAKILTEVWTNLSVKTNSLGKRWCSKSYDAKRSKATQSDVSIVELYLSETFLFKNEFDTSEVFELSLLQNTNKMYTVELHCTFCRFAHQFSFCDEVGSFPNWYLVYHLANLRKTCLKMFRVELYCIFSAKIV